MEIKIFTTGGSIDKLYSTRVSNFIVGDPQIGSVLQESHVSLVIKIERLFQKDSLEITEADRSIIFQKVQSDTHRHIIITHGTDTMILTGKMLCEIPGRVIVLTGAMQPAAFKVTDAAFNTGGAIIAVQTLPEGVYIVMNGQVFDPFHVRKNLELDRFEINLKALHHRAGRSIKNNRNRGNLLCPLNTWLKYSCHPLKLSFTRQ